MCVYLGVTCNLKFFNNAAELFATHKYPSHKKKKGSRQLQDSQF